MFRHSLILSIGAVLVASFSLTAGEPPTWEALWQRVKPRYRQDGSWLVIRPDHRGRVNPRIAELVRQNACAQDVSPVIALAVTEQESGWRAFDNASNRALVSEDGAIGVLQVLPSTAKMLGYSREGLDRLESNIQTGIAYLKRLQNKFGHDNNVALLAGYVAGEHFYKRRYSSEVEDEITSYVNSGIRRMPKFSGVTCDVTIANLGEM